MEVVVFIGIGSNLHNRLYYIEEALRYLNTNPLTEILAVSSFYETEPLSSVPQGYYLNGVVKISTSLSPEALLELLQNIEEKLGRVRDKKDAPRTIDLDILLYGDSIVRLPHLSIPHPRMWEREFVLKPLFEIAPELITSIQRR